MAHQITGLVAKYEPLAAAMHLPVVVAPLAQGFGLAVDVKWPIWVDEDPEEPPIEITELAARIGASVPIALVATDYDGGPGYQGAAVWGPQCEMPYTIGTSSINVALERIGVTASGECDEFDALGLGWYRSNEDWIEFAKNGKSDWQYEAEPAAAEAWRKQNQ